MTTFRTLRRITDGQVRKTVGATEADSLARALLSSILTEALIKSAGVVLRHKKGDPERTYGAVAIVKDGADGTFKLRFTIEREGRGFDAKLASSERLPDKEVQQTAE